MAKYTGEDYVAYAQTWQWKAPEPLPGVKWEQQGKRFCDKLVSILKEEKGAVIGHVKGFLDLAEAGYCYFSNVGTSQGTSCRSCFSAPASCGRFDLNVLVYGLAREEIEALVQRRAHGVLSFEL